uniref:UBN2 domain-containing protein n=1 Tax=Tanacetum cinerariifolium TaxID=118510 RepID=A0A6L2LH98_TANCI|nr:UBN2 domain-containing protein [Tanacetum cinerariifolium]
MSGLKALQSYFTFLSDVLEDFSRVPTFKRTFSHDMDLLEKHFTKEILHEIDCKTALIKLRTMFKDTFNQMTDKYFVEYTGIELKHFKDTLLQHLGQHHAEQTELINEDSDFARFNTIITSLKAVDDGYSRKNYVRKFLRALHSKWRANVTVIDESKDLTSLSLDELIEYLRVHRMIIKKDSKIVKAKGKRRSLALKGKKEYSNEKCLTSRSEDKEYAMEVRDFKKLFKRRGRFVRQPRNEKRHFKEADTTRMAKVIGSVLDAVIQIILSENVRNHQRTRTKELSSKVLRVISMSKMMKRLKMKRASWLKHLARYAFGIDLEHGE